MEKRMNPGPDYDGALWGATLAVRRDRHFYAATGKAPGDMLNGLISNSPPPPLGPEEDGRVKGAVVYAALLTAKGRMITDLRLFREPDGGFLLDLSLAGAEAAEDHFRKFLPPRLAKVEDRGDEITLLTMLGPEAPTLLANVGGPLGITFSSQELEELREGQELVLASALGSSPRVTRNGDHNCVGWDLILPSPLADELVSGLDSAGVVPLSTATSEILRVEGGRPTFGRDMDETIIPVEAGIQDRAIDNDKGCYTGQEVVIRIRDRGQVNKVLRGFHLGEVKPPSKGTELFVDGREKSVGWITTAVSSPAFGQTVALGYAQRMVDAGAVVRVGAPDGPEGHVRALSQDGWASD
jgi:aminomethyltransferase